MKWLVYYVKCLDFILKVLVWGLVFGLTELEASIEYSWTES